ncbi:hypothetical protein CTAYLR_002467 [Chrysophaeum taylorii]|uniref:Histone-lysine N-methyltransferase n=1 Tax=Chrysophaeum taylorii TaxID=2483200 RepID=A0AAD7UP38_9STRA|nr:hypothetical protein CTAYLR_002467 [Chrysophaeum taylorii]
MAPSSRRKRSSEAPPMRDLPEDSYIGCRVKHFWEGDAQWYEGRILDQVGAQTYVIRYDDGEYHEVIIDTAKELMLIGRGVYMVKQPGHCAWPALHYEMTEAAAQSNKVRGYDPSKCYAIFFQTLQYVWISRALGGAPAIAEPGAFKRSRCKRTGVLVDHFSSNVRDDPELARVLEKPGKKSETLAEAIDLAEAELQLREEQRVKWRKHKPLPPGVVVVESDEALALPTDFEEVEAPQLQQEEEEPPAKKVKLSNKCAACGRANCNEATNAARCDACANIYHLECWGGPELKKPPSTSQRGKRWLCADCLACDRCGRTQRVCGPANKVARPRLDVVNRHGEFFLPSGLLRSKGTKVAFARPDGKGYLCRECLEAYRTGKLCATCHREWDEDEPRMIKCDGPGCRLWAHAECDGLDEEAYDSIGNGTHPVFGLEFLCAAGCAVKVSTRLIAKLQEQDELLLFARPVDPTIAPTYLDVVKRPMDLATMLAKAEAGEYRSTQMLRDDTELMCANAVTFNRAGDRFWREACRFFNASTKIFESLDIDRTPQQANSEEAAGQAEKQLTEGENGAAAAAAAEKPRESYIQRKSVRSAHADVIDRVRENYFSTRAKERASRDATVRKDALAGTAVKRVQRVERVPCHDPASCVAVAEVRLDKDSAARVHAWLDICLVCGSGEAVSVTDSTYEYHGPPGGEFLFCVDCGEAFHAFCAMAPIATMDAAAKLSWRCPNCKLCELCGRCKPEDESQLVYCDFCDKGYHLDCVEPPLAAAPPGRWICGLCVDCKHCDAAGQDPSRARWSSRQDACASCLVHAKTVDASRAPLGGKCAALNGCLVEEQQLGNAVVPLPGKACAYCAARFHDQCALAFLRDDDFGERACLRCVAQLGSLASGDPFVTHLGADDAAWRCAVACSRVQRRRLCAKKTGVTLTPERRRRPILRGWTEFFESWEGAPRAKMLDAVCREALGGDWTDTRQCALCKKRGDCVDAGRLVPVHDNNNSWVHINCARWSSEVYEVDRSMVKVRNAIARSRTLRCTKCGGPGATMGCCDTSCRTNYHFRCGAAAGAVCVDGVRVLCARCYAKGSELLSRVCAPAPAARQMIPPATAAAEDATPASTSPARAELSADDAAAAATGEVRPPDVAAVNGELHNNPSEDTPGNKDEDDDGENGSVEEAHGLHRVNSVPANLEETASPMDEIPGDAPSALPCVPSSDAVDEDPAPAVALLPPDDFDDDFEDDENAPRSRGDGKDSDPTKRISRVIDNVGDVAASVVVPSQLDFENAGCRHDPYEYFIKRRAKEVLAAAAAAAVAEVLAMKKKPAIKKPRAAVSKPPPLEEVEVEEITPEHAEWLDKRVRKARELGDVFRIGSLVVHDVGRIAHVGCRFHCRDRIFPLGYRATRIFWSATRPATRVAYVCEILDGAALDDDAAVSGKSQQGHHPVFRVTALDNPDAVFQSVWNPRGAVRKLHRAVDMCNAAAFRRREDGGHYSTRHHFRSYGLGDDGAGFFGLSIPALRARIEDLPNAVAAALDIKPAHTNGPVPDEEEDDDGDPLPVVQPKRLKLRPPISVVRPANGPSHNGLMTSTAPPARASPAVAAPVPAAQRAPTIAETRQTRRKRPQSTGENGDSGQQEDARPASSKRQASGSSAPTKTFKPSRRRKTSGLVNGYTFCYVQPSVGDVLGAQREVALRDADIKPNPSGCARAEPRDTTDEAARARITRSLVRAAKEQQSDDVPEARQSQAKSTTSGDALISSPSPFSGIVSALQENRDKYRRMKALPMSARLEVRRSHIHGWGLFLKRDVRKDEFIVEYLGQIVRQVVGDKREKYYDQAGFGSCYLFRLDNDLIVDATRRGNVGRFINHCCKPNAYARVVNVEAQVKKIVIIALVDLRAGDEVMYDYKFPIEDDKVPCFCGAPNCRGSMN